MGARLTKDGFQSVLDDKGIDAKIIGSYEGAMKKTWFLLGCGHGVYSRPNQVRNGKGCGVCLQESFPTSEKINAKLEQQKRSVRAIEPYVDSETKIAFTDKCGHTWRARVHDILSGSGCSYCHGTQKMTKEEVNRNLKIKGRSARIVGDYCGNGIKTTFTDDCGHFWEATTINVLHNGHGCPDCFGNHGKLNRDSINFRLELAGRDVRLVGGYKNLRTPTLWSSSCGHEWEATASHILHSNTSCTKCEHRGTANDKLYIWEAVGEFVDGVQVYKFGATSQRRGDFRIRDVARKHGFDYKILRLATTEGKATDIENILKKIGPKLEGYKGDGSTELRAWTDAQLTEALAIVDAGTKEEDVLAA